MEPTNAAQNSAVEAMLTPEQNQQLQQAGIATGLIAGLIKAFLAALMANLPNLVGAIPATPAKPPTPTKR